MASTGKEEAKAAKRPLGRRLLFAALAVLLSLTALAGGLLAAMGPEALKAMVAGEGEIAAPEDHAATPEAEHGTEGDGGGHGAAAQVQGYEVLPFQEMIVNITSVTLNGRTTSRFLKVNLAMVYDPAAEGGERIAERHLYLRDSFQEYLRQLTETDLQGSLGLATLKDELLRRARTITDSDAPHEVLIADLIVQ